MEITVTTNPSNSNENTKPKLNEFELIESIQRIIFGLNKDNFSQSLQSIIAMFDYNYPYSFNQVITQFIYFYSSVSINDFDIWFDFMKEIDTFQETKKIKPKISEVFYEFFRNETQDSNYLFLKMIERNILDPKILENSSNPFFVHYMTKEEIEKQKNKCDFQQIFNNYEALSKNDWELHKQYIKEGHNPSEIAKIIRNDEIEKLQEISSQANFDFNQKIEPSIYERCFFVNLEDVSLIDYAAFFSAVKCFKYLLMNNAKLENIGKYSVAGGNLEIIHLCVQNHASFDYAYETAVLLHRNEIFHYLHDNNIVEMDRLEDLALICICVWNFEIFAFLLDNGLKINEYIINKAAELGNLYLVKYFLKENPIPKNILLFSLKVQNIELVKYILDQKGIDINANDIYLFYFKFI